MPATPPHPPDVDVSAFAAALALAGFIWGPTAAQFVAAYALILFAWFGGLLVGLYRRNGDARLPSWAYALITLVVCVGMTVPIAQWLSSYLGASYTGLLLPVAFLIAAAPDKWQAAGSWAWDTWKAIKGIK